MRFQPRSIPSGRRGFTLVELLVVMGIIVLLLAILLPTVGRVRIQAQTARTWANMSAIAGAIERYHGDEMAYPGLFSNAQLGGAGLPGTITITPAATSRSDVAGTPGGDITGTENMVLSLVGGYAPNGTAATTASLQVKIDDASIGGGPMTLSPSVVKRTKRAAYIDSGSLLPQKPYASSGYARGDPDAPGTPTAPGSLPDSGAPEFHDAYSNPRPIIYLRANITNSPTARMVATSANGIGDNGELARYTIREFDFYKRGPATTSPNDFPGDFTWGADLGDFERHPFVEAYLGNPATIGSIGTAATAAQRNAAPRGQNKYILLSAGPDRCFGTRDDLFFGGN